VAILPYSDEKEGKTMAERIREAVETTPAPYDDQQLSTTLSIGLAASPPCDRDGPALEALAGNAVNRAKSSGKNCVMVASPNMPTASH
jgi:GGDEF domain-containing protein